MIVESEGPHVSSHACTTTNLSIITEEIDPFVDALPILDNEDSSAEPLDNEDVMPIDDRFHSREGLHSPSLSAQSSDDPITDSPLKSDNSHECLNRPSHFSDDEVQFTRGPLKNKFMDTKKILELMKGPHILLPEIPNDNSENIERRSHDDNSEFWNDSGAWEDASSPSTLFTQVGGKLI